MVPIQVWMSGRDSCDRRAVHSTSTGICKMPLPRCLSLVWNSCPRRRWCSSKHCFPLLGGAAHPDSRGHLSAGNSELCMWCLPVKDAESCIVLCPCAKKSVWGPWSLQGPARRGVIYDSKADMGGHRSEGWKVKAVPGGSLIVHFQCVSRLQFYRWQLNQRSKWNSFIIKPLHFNLLQIAPVTAKWVTAKTVPWLVALPVNIISVSAHCSHPGQTCVCGCKAGLKWAGRAAYGKTRMEVERAEGIWRALYSCRPGRAV